MLKILGGFPVEFRPAVGRELLYGSLDFSRVGWDLSDSTPGVLFHFQILAKFHTHPQSDSIANEYIQNPLNREWYRVSDQTTQFVQYIKQ